MQFQLRSSYAADWRGGTIAYQGGTYNIGTALTAGGGTITTTDPTLIALLDGVPALQRTGAPDPPGATPDFYGTILVRVPSGTPANYVPALQADGTWLAVAAGAGSGGGTVSTGTAAPSSLPVGDTYFQLDGSGNVIAEWVGAP